MGLLQSAQRAAMEDGNARYRQVWLIGRPPSAGSIAYEYTTMHDDEAGARRVVDPGVRETQAYNVSLQEPGRMPTGLYTVVCANDDGAFYTTTDTNFWKHSNGYQAEPTECLLLHFVYIWAGGTWSLLTMAVYVGTVSEVRYRDSAREAEIHSVSRVFKILTSTWATDDGDEIDTGLTIDVT